jgi:hypothetical protein
MTKSTALTQAKHEAKVVEVLGLTIDGKHTVIEACEVVGVPVSTFYEWVKRGSDTIDAFRDLLSEQYRLQLLYITAARASNIRSVAEQVTNEDNKVSIKERKIADTMLAKYGDELERSLHAAPGHEEAASQFLQRGPKLKTQQSRFASMEIESTEDGLRIDLYKDDDVIDAETKDVD